MRLESDLVIIDDKDSRRCLDSRANTGWNGHASLLEPFHTSNRTLEDWGRLLSDVPTAGAILIASLHHAITIGITPRSYRSKDSLPPARPAKNMKDQTNLWSPGPRAKGSQLGPVVSNSLRAIPILNPMTNLV